MNDKNLIEKPVMSWTLLNKSNVKEASRLLFFLKTRKVQRVIKYLNGHYQSVTDLYIAARLTQSEVSQFLRGMRYFGLVQSKRVGKFIYYKLNIEEMSRMKSVIHKIANLGYKDTDSDDEDYILDPVPQIEPIFPMKIQAIGQEI